MRREFVPYHLLFYFVPKKPKAGAFFTVYHGKWLFADIQTKQSSRAVVHDTKTNEDQYTVDIRLKRFFFLTPCVTWRHHRRPRSHNNPRTPNLRISGPFGNFKRLVDRERGRVPAFDWMKRAVWDRVILEGQSYSAQLAPSWYATAKSWWESR